MSPVEGAVIASLITGVVTLLGGGLLVGRRSTISNRAANGGWAVVTDRGQIYINEPPNPYDRISQDAADKIELGKSLEKERRQKKYLTIAALTLVVTILAAFAAYVILDETSDQGESNNGQEQPIDGEARTKNTNPINYEEVLGLTCNQLPRQKDANVGVSYRLRECNAVADDQGKKISFNVYLSTYDSFSDRYKRQPDYLGWLSQSTAWAGDPINIVMEGTPGRWNQGYDGISGTYYMYKQVFKDGGVAGKIWLMQDGTTEAAVLDANWTKTLKGSFGALERFLASHGFALSSS